MQHQSNSPSSFFLCCTSKEQEIDEIKIYDSNRNTNRSSSFADVQPKIEKPQSEQILQNVQDEKNQSILTRKSNSKDLILTSPTGSKTYLAKKLKSLKEILSPVEVYPQQGNVNIHTQQDKEGETLQLYENQNSPLNSTMSPNKRKLLLRSSTHSTPKSNQKRLFTNSNVKGKRGSSIRESLFSSSKVHGNINFIQEQLDQLGGSPSKLMNLKVTLNQVVSKYSPNKLDKLSPSSQSDDCEEGMIMTDSDEEEKLLKIVIRNPSEDSNDSQKSEKVFVVRASNASKYFSQVSQNKKKSSRNSKYSKFLSVDQKMMKKDLTAKMKWQNIGLESQYYTFSENNHLQVDVEVLDSNQDIININNQIVSPINKEVSTFKQIKEEQEISMDQSSTVRTNPDFIKLQTENSPNKFFSKPQNQSKSSRNYGIFSETDVEAIFSNLKLSDQQQELFLQFLNKKSQQNKKSDQTNEISDKNKLSQSFQNPQKSDNSYTIMIKDKEIIELNDLKKPQIQTYVSENYLTLGSKLETISPNNLSQSKSMSALGNKMNSSYQTTMVNINNSHKNISYESNVTTIIERGNAAYDSTFQLDRGNTYE